LVAVAAGGASGLCGLLCEGGCGGELTLGDTGLAVLAPLFVVAGRGLGQGVLMVWLTCLGRIVDGPIGRGIPAVLVVALWVVLLPHYLIHCLPAGPKGTPKVSLSRLPPLRSQSIVHVVIAAFAHELMLQPIFEAFLIIEGMHLVVCLEVVGLPHTARGAFVVSRCLISAKRLEALSAAIEVFLEAGVVGGELVCKGVVPLRTCQPLFFGQFCLPFAKFRLLPPQVGDFPGKVLLRYEELMLALVVFLLGGLQLQTAVLKGGFLPLQSCLLSLQFCLFITIGLCFPRGLF
jgi:hypothetical protein